MTLPTIALIVGSLRRGSFNGMLAQVASEALQGRANVVVVDYADVPFLNQDVEHPAPEPVARVVEQVRHADALWMFAPEYNGSYTAVLKNLIDWLSRPFDPTFQDITSALTGKTVALSSAAGRSAGALVREHLTTLLQFVNAKVLEQQVGVVLPSEAFATGAFTPSEDDRKAIAEQADALLAAIA